MRREFSDRLHYCCQYLLSFSGDALSLQQSASMPETRRSATDDDTLAIRIIAPLNDDQVLSTMKKVMFPHALDKKIDSLVQQVDSFTKQLTKKDGQIDNLEKRVRTLEADADRHEQYSRRPNLRIQGIKETTEGTTEQ